MLYCLPAPALPLPSQDHRSTPFLFSGIPSPAQWELSGIEPWGSSKASPCDGPKAKGRALGKHSQDQGRPGALLAAIRADAGQTCSDAGHRDRGCRRRLSAQPKSGCASGKCPPTPMPPCPLRCQPQGARCTESTTHMGTGRAGLQGGCLLAGSMMETPWSRACAHGRSRLQAYGCSSSASKQQQWWQQLVSEGPWGSSGFASHLPSAGSLHDPDQHWCPSQHSKRQPLAWLGPINA